MVLILDEEMLLEAYKGRQDLQDAIRNAATAGPQYVELFNYISAHINNLLSNLDAAQKTSKKRKLDDGRQIKVKEIVDTSCRLNEVQEASTGGRKDADANKATPLLRIEGISFILPKRKKFTLCMTQEHLYAQQGPEGNIVYGTKVAWKDLGYIFLIPMPEKVQVQHGFIFFTPNSYCLLSNKSSASNTNESSLPQHPTLTAPPEPILFTIPSTSSPKLDTISGTLSNSISAVSDDYLTLFLWAIKKRLKAAGSSSEVISADGKLFSSAQKQSYRPQEKAVWVRAFRGSKEGFLFFLPCGILWTFRKPLLFLSHSKILAISFTGVLKRTFNLNVEIVTDVVDSGTEELEFTMLDQEDFENINQYINRYGLQDGSLAEQRKAKLLNINRVRDKNGNISDFEADELANASLNEENITEGQAKGNSEMIDQDEDEEGEDYDPGSEGDSEGSGSTSSSEEEIGNDNEFDAAEDQNNMNDSSD